MQFIFDFKDFEEEFDILCEMSVKIGVKGMFMLVLVFVFIDGMNQEK